MTIGSALYKLLIGPLALFFEVVFALANRVLPNPGLCIIFLSLAMNFLVLPLYRRADILQAEERDREAQMKPWVDRIKRAFKGDERFMILQTYYRQNGYKQTDALKGSLSLLLEIPFFIAAYRFLSSLELLQGVSFGPIRDLGAPDALLTIAGLRVNLLPILMTAVNAVSAAVYMKGFPLKNKLQMYGMALIFLVFLYGSPAGLVFYWTLNNVFSLLKNIFYKLKKPGLVLSILSSLVGAAGLLLLLFVHPMATHRRQILMLILVLMLQLPLLAILLKRQIKPRLENKRAPDDRLFRLSGLLLTVLTGVLIPSAVIHASPAEFIDAAAYRSPLWYVLSSALLAAGTFIVWFGIFYRLSNDKGKRLFSVVMWLVAGAAIVNYMIFGTDYGNLLPTLVYSVYPTVPLKKSLINLGVLLAVCAMLFLIWRIKPAIPRVISLAAGLALLVMSAMNLTGIYRESERIRSGLESEIQTDIGFTLSRNGRNVVVIMLDRAMGCLVPYLTEENPKLLEQFAGFTYYPNTVSFGAATNVGSPALFGGYEYTPLNMNRRSDEKLVDKQNEALKVMPVLFDENGYEVTVCDPTYAGYSLIPDLSIYDDHPNIRRYITKGKYAVKSSALMAGSDLEETERLRNRNFFCYSLFRITPQLAQPSIYNRGAYNAVSSVNVAVQTRLNLVTAEGLDSGFMDSYAVLNNLPEIGSVTEGAENTFVMLSNDTTHEPTLLQEPDYEPMLRVDNRSYEAEAPQRPGSEGSTLHLDDEMIMTLYHVNMAALIQLGNWMDTLRENGVYDNTRIILVADHGWGTTGIEQGAFDSEWQEVATSFNPLLLVKDFDSRDFVIDERFMTHADVPSIALAGLIDEAVNPYTGRKIDSSAKEAGEQYLLISDWDTEINNGTAFMDGQWYSVHDDIRKDENWQKLAAQPG